MPCGGEGVGLFNVVLKDFKFVFLSLPLLSLLRLPILNLRASSSACCDGLIDGSGSGGGCTGGGGGA